MKLAAAALSSLLAGCSLTQLTPLGKGVEMGAAARADCKLLGAVQAAEGRNFQSPTTNIAAVEASLRNQAAERGGDLIVLTSQQLGQNGEAGCPNCIAMTASVFRCGAAPAAASASAPAPAKLAGPSREAVDAALGAAAESARACGPAGGPRGEARVDVVFSSSGDVVYSEVKNAPFADTPAGDCIARKFRNARVPPFEGAPASFTKAVPIPP